VQGANTEENEEQNHQLRAISGRILGRQVIVGEEQQSHAQICCSCTTVTFENIRKCTPVNEKNIYLTRH